MITLKVDYDSPALLEHPARIPRGGPREIRLIFYSGGEQYLHAESTTVALRLYIPDDLVNPVGELTSWTRDTESNSYLGTIDTGSGVLGALGLNTLFGRIAWIDQDSDLIETTNFHVLYAAAAQASGKDFVDWDKIINKPSSYPPSTPIENMSGALLRDESIPSAKLSKGSDDEKVQTANLCAEIISRFTDIEAQRSLIDLSNTENASVLLRHFSSEVLEMIDGGMNPSDYIGIIDTLSYDLPDPASNSNKWAYCRGITGTMNGLNAPSEEVESGSFLLCDGTQWLVRPPSPNTLSDESVTTSKLSLALQSTISKSTLLHSISVMGTAWYAGLQVIGGIINPAAEDNNKELFLVLEDGSIISPEIQQIKDRIIEIEAQKASRDMDMLITSPFIQMLTIPFIGQSNQRRLSNTRSEPNPYPTKLLGTNLGVLAGSAETSTGGVPVLMDGDISDITDWDSTGITTTGQVFDFSKALADFCNDYYNIVPRLLVNVFAKDAMRLSTWAASGQFYSNWAIYLDQIKDLSKARGFNPVVPCIFLDQGESDEQASMSADSYLSLLEEIRSAWSWKSNDSLDNVLEVPLFLPQKSSHGFYEHNVSAGPLIAQLEADEENPLIFVTNPQYFFETVEGVHYTQIYQAIQGAYLAKAFNRYFYGNERNLCLRPSSITRVGTTITITPVGRIGDLVIDTVLVSDPGDYGFKLYNTSSTISSISLSADKKSILVETNLPADENSAEISYAWESGASTGVPVGTQPTTGARGNIRDSDCITYDAGDGDYTLYNWMCHFKKNIN